MRGTGNKEYSIRTMRKLGKSACYPPAPSTVSFLTGQTGGPGGVVDYLTRITEGLSDMRRDTIKIKVIHGGFTQKEVDESILFSLQYVPHGFQKKGLAYSLAKQIQSFRYNCPTHIMFHEIWVFGGGKQTFLRAAQKVIAKKIVRALSPISISTSNHFYRDQLSKIGIRAEVLPIFSNIKRATPDAFFDKKMPPYKLVIFGAFPRVGEVAEWFESLAKELAVRGTSASVIMLGRQDPSLVHDLSRFMNTLRPNLSVEVIGDSSPAEISRILIGCHAGITATPSHLIAKSGGAQAMILHGLPIFAPILGPHRYTEANPQIQFGNIPNKLAHIEVRFKGEDNFRDSLLYYNKLFEIRDQRR